MVEIEDDIKQNSEDEEVISTDKNMYLLIPTLITYSNFIIKENK